MHLCPSTESLRELLTEGAPADPADAVRVHVRDCTACQGRLDELSGDNGLRAWLAPARPPGTAYADEEALRRVIDRLLPPPTDADPPAAREPASFLGPPRQPGDLGSLGPYRILAELGRGGMSIVYRGHDESLGRPVAVKVLRPELADPGARACLVREAQLAARSQHEHIVRVYAVADPPDGPPYLVMEYLAGETLADVLRRRQRLDATEAVALVVQAADGLAAAHAAGLVHRDVKPGNLLLEAGTGCVKVLDFGLARAGEAASGLTRIGTVAGTPTYMAPEQLRSPAPADPRTDVYSLGVTLYEALTGEAPFRGAPAMLVRQVLEDEPRPPRALNDAVPRDLEVVCLRAMAKEPGRRYPSVAALADDLRRWQRGEPIRARPAGRGERCWRWCRRNPGVALLSAALLAVFLVGFGGMAWQWRRAESEADEARRAADEARKAADETERQRQQAYRSFVQARSAVDRYLTSVSESRELQGRQLEPLRRQLLTAARDYYETFVREHPDDPDLRADLGRAYGRLGAIAVILDGSPRSLPLFEKKRAVFEGLVHERPDEPAYRHELADAYWHLGFGRHYVGDKEAAWAAFRRARDLWDELTRRYPDEPEYAARLVRTFNSLGRSLAIFEDRSAAEQTFRQGLAAYARWTERHPADAGLRESRAWLLSNLGSLYRVTDQPAEARQPLEQAAALGEALVREHPGSFSYREVWHHALIELGQLSYTVSDAAAAARAVTQARAVAEGLLHDQPANGDYQALLAEALILLGSVRDDLQDRPADAAAAYAQARVIQERLADERPAAWPYRANLVDVYYRLFRVLCATGQGPKALELCTSAVRRWEAVPQPAADPYSRSQLAGLYAERAHVHTLLGHYPEALADCDRARALCEGTPAAAHAQGLRAVVEARSLLEKGDPVRAAALADRAAAQAGGAATFAGREGEVLYLSAAVLARAAGAVTRQAGLTAAERERLSARYAAGAVGRLKAARDAGYFKLLRCRHQLTRDADFQALRGRPDWRQFLAGLK